MTKAILNGLRQYPEHIEFYDLNSLPLLKDCFLISNERIDTIERQWTEFLALDCNYEKWEHPNSLMDYIHCHITSRNATHLDISLLINSSNRYHTVKMHLSNKYFISAFKVYSSEKRPYIIVDKNWFNGLRNNNYSTYALIDFIGIREKIYINGEIPIGIIKKIKQVVDQACIANPNLIFLSCADNIIVKSTWTTGENMIIYEPEIFVETIHKLMNDIQTIAEIGSYAILTQGVNYIDEKELQDSSTPTNHYFLSSISVPWIEAFEIDKNIRTQIHVNAFDKMPFYLEQSFYISMNRKYYSGKEPSWYREVQFHSDTLGMKLTYSPLTIERIRNLIDDAPKEEEFV